MHHKTIQETQKHRPTEIVGDYCHKISAIKAMVLAASYLSQQPYPEAKRLALEPKGWH